MNLIVFSPEEWGRPLPADDERAVHVREVLRLEPGDSLRVGLLGAGAGTAVCRGFSRDGGRELLRLDFPEAADLSPAGPLLPITLVLGQPRPPVMQRLLKDLGAIGVGRVLVTASELSEKSYMQSRLWQGHPAAGTEVSDSPVGAGQAAADGAWRRQLIAGAQQGGHCRLMAVERHYGLRRALDAAAGPDGAEAPPAGCFVLDLAPGAEDFLGLCAGLAASRAAAASAGGAAGAGLVVAIGPERGWSEAERALFAARGFRPFGLGRRILRTETAAVLACGMLALGLDDE